MPGSLTDLAGLTSSAEDFLAAVLETAAQPIWVVDPDDRIRFANPAAIAALGYDGADELLGRDSHETIHYRHPDGTPYPAEECPMLLPRATGRDGRAAIWTGSSAATARCFPSPTSRRRSRWARAAAPSSRSPTSRIACAPRRCCASTTPCSQRGRRRCGASRRWWPAERRRRTCSPPSPRRWRRCWACRWSRLALRARRDGDRARRLGRRPHPFQVGGRWRLDDPAVRDLHSDRETGRPARIDDLPTSRPVADIVRSRDPLAPPAPRSSSTASCGA